MKLYTKIVLLVALAFVLALTACTRAASTPPVVQPTNTGEVPFPIVTEDPVAAAATQTAIANQPLPAAPTETPQVVVETQTPAEGGEAQPPAEGGEAAEATATPDPNAGGGSGDAGAAANPPAPQPVTPVERPQTYTLQQGEWPICIARRYDLDLGAFFSLNGLNMNSKPAAGTTLKIPASGNWSSQYGARQLRQHPTTHTVTSGQSVNAIACYYGDVAPESILQVNGYGSAADVKAGTTINIP